MKHVLLVLILSVPVCLWAGCGQQTEAASAEESPRVVVLGGSVAETVVKLGAADLLVARDDASVYPDTLANWPSVGYFRAIGAEGVLSVNPTLILADVSAGPDTALRQLEATGLRIIRLPGGSTPEDTEAQIRAIADALDRSDEAEAIIEDLRWNLAAASRVVAGSGRTHRVLFALGQNGGNLTFAGRNTNADALIRLAGGENVFADVEGYKPMGAEAIIQASPDVVLLLQRTVDAFGGVEGIAARPEMRGTNPRFIVLPDAALSFGPSLGTFVLDFARRLHAQSEEEYLEMCAMGEGGMDL